MSGFFCSIKTKIGRGNPRPYDYFVSILESIHEIF